MGRSFGKKDIQEIQSAWDNYVRAMAPVILSRCEFPTDPDGFEKWAELVAHLTARAADKLTAMRVMRTMFMLKQLEEGRSGDLRIVPDPPEK